MASKGDPVNHPKYYTFGKIEVIDVIEDWNLPYHIGNSIKYLARAGKKSKKTEEQDLKKAAWYINRYIGFIGKKARKKARKGKGKQ